MELDSRSEFALQVGQVQKLPLVNQPNQYHIEFLADKQQLLQSRKRKLLSTGTGQS
jgi:hypothetical protein